MDYEDNVIVNGREETIRGFLSYCESHSRTSRALFHKEDIAVMVELAGRPSDYSSPEEWRVSKCGGLGNFHSMHEEMRELIALVQKRIECGLEAKTEPAKTK